MKNLKLSKNAAKPLIFLGLLLAAAGGEMCPNYFQYTQHFGKLSASQYKL